MNYDIEMYWIDVHAEALLWPHRRTGQNAFNVLAYNRPDLADKVRCSEFDPFYQDEHLVDFARFLNENW